MPTSHRTSWAPSSPVSGIAADGFYGIRFESIGGLGAHLAGQILAEAGVLGCGLNGSHFSSYGSVPEATAGLAVDEHGCIVADPATGATSREGIFGGGDVTTGAATVILAMGAGRRSAAAIDEYIRTKATTGKGCHDE